MAGKKEADVLGGQTGLSIGRKIAPVMPQSKSKKKLRHMSQCLSFFPGVNGWSDRDLGCLGSRVGPEVLIL